MFTNQQHVNNAIKGIAIARQQYKTRAITYTRLILIIKTADKIIARYK